MYPLKFVPIYFEKIWGGRGIEALKSDVPEGRIGESWELSCHKNGTNIIKNGKYKDRYLVDLINEKKELIIGKKYRDKKFPILIKFITASEDLSIQVHPDNNYAKLYENDNGKSEVWYIVKSKNGKIVCGLNNIDGKNIKEIMNRDIMSHLNYLDVKKDELYYIKAGLVHAIGKGITLLEIQESSDLTYRVYDYGRNRELHIEKACDVINSKLECKRRKFKLRCNDNYVCYEFGNFNSFKINKYEIKKSLMGKSNKDGFSVYICIKGKGVITYINGTETIKLGETILIPSSLGEYCIIGNLELIEVIL